MINVEDYEILKKLNI